MKVMEKIVAKGKDKLGQKPVTIAFLGDSVTQGCFEVYYKRDGRVETVYDSQNAFSYKLKNILNYLCPSAQINIVNSGISGDYAQNGVQRFDRDIAPYQPDLVVIGFALNDSALGNVTLQSYGEALETLFGKVKDLGAECIFLTPNLMNDRVSPHITDARIEELANWFKDVDLDSYVETAKATAQKCGVPVCDVYAKWKALQAVGVDITELLANKLNHPTREMNNMTAMMLAEMILEK